MQPHPAAQLHDGDAVGRRGRNMALKRQRICAAASHLFGEQHFDSVTIQAIAEEADVAAGTLFRYASSKADLLLMAYNAVFESAISAGAAGAATQMATADAVMAVIAPTVTAAARNPRNTMVYQRELLFGDAENRFREDGLALVAQLELVIADILAASTPPPNDAAAAITTRQAAHLGARSVFAVLHLLLANPGAVTEFQPGSSGYQHLHQQISQIVVGFRQCPLPHTTKE